VRAICRGSGSAAVFTRFLTAVYTDNTHINVGSGEELSILDTAKLAARVIGFEGKLVHGLSKPDGTPRKLIDSSKLRALGCIGLEEGMRTTYKWFLTNKAER
jgi:GDP-L-fucose synthase